VAQAVDFGGDQSFHVADFRQFVQPCQRCLSPSQDQHGQVSRCLAVNFIRRRQLAGPGRPFSGKVAGQKQPAGALGREAVARTGAAEDLAAHAVAEPQLEVGAEREIRTLQARLAHGEARDGFARCQIDAGVDPGFAVAWHVDERISCQFFARQLFEQGFEAAAKVGLVQRMNVVHGNPPGGGLQHAGMGRHHVGAG